MTTATPRLHTLSSLIAAVQADYLAATGKRIDDHAAIRQIDRRIQSDPVLWARWMRLALRIETDEEVSR